MNTANKYSPYQGYGNGKPWYWYHYRHAFVPPTREHTRGDWVWKRSKRDNFYEGYVHYTSRYSGRVLTHTAERCNRCGKDHCSWCGCEHFWKKYSRTRGSTFEKRDVHRRFRRQTKHAIWRELMGDDDVSHNFFVSGDWLD